MRSVWILLRRELLSYFVSPVAYAVLIAFVLLAGWYFQALLGRFLTIVARSADQAMMFQQLPPVVNVNMGVMRPWFSIVSQLILFLAPLVTMRLLAEERGTGRIDLLLSAPLTDLQLVLGKFLSGVALCYLFLFPTLAYPAILFRFGNPEAGSLAAGYLGLLLLVPALISLGLAVSSLTNNQVVAAAGSFGLIIMLWGLGFVSDGEGSGWRTVVAYFSLLQHFGEFANGVISTRDVVFYVSFTGFMLYLTLRAVESQRWRG